MKRNRLRNNQINIFLSDEELETFKLKCEELELSKSEYIRQIILFGQIVESKKLDKIEMDKMQNLMYELNRIGNNINQIAFKVNAKNEILSNDILEVKEQLSFISDFIEQYYT